MGGALSSMVSVAEQADQPAAQLAAWCYPNAQLKRPAKNAKAESSECYSFD
jgi:hypothetical protein